MSSGESAITIKKVNVMDLRRWLDIPLPPGSMNRNRNEFINLLKPYADEIEQSRVDILKQYAKKDEQGNQDLNNPTFEGENGKKAEEEYQELVKEPVVITITKPMALEIARAVLRSTQVKFGFEEGQRFDEVCEAMGVEFKDEEAPKAKSPIIIS